MKDFAVYGLFILAGFLLGGAYSLYKVNKAATVVLGVLGALAVAGGVLQMIGQW